MRYNRLARIVVTFAAFALTTSCPAEANPIARLHYLVGAWNCTYRAGSVRMPYHTTYAYDGGGTTLRQIASFGNDGDEQLFAYDEHRGGWTVVVLDSHGNATIMHANGSDPNHIVYRSVYPDATIADTFDRVSATSYTLHARFQMGGKNINSVDTCSRTMR
jgi:hypothetical protein